MAKDALDQTDEPKVEEQVSLGETETVPPAMLKALEALHAELDAAKAELAARALIAPTSPPTLAPPVKWHYSTGKNGTVTATTTPDGD